MDAEDQRDIDGGAIEAAMARVRPVGMLVLGVSAIGGLLALAAAGIAISVAVSVAVGANSNAGPAMGVGVAVSVLYLLPAVPLVLVAYGTLQAMRARSYAWARVGALALILSGALMPLLVGLGSYCVGMCPALAFAVLALPIAGYALGVLSDPAVRRGFELARREELEAQAADRLLGRLD
jgi:hypothetical protein